MDWERKTSRKGYAAGRTPEIPLPGNEFLEKFVETDLITMIEDLTKISGCFVLCQLYIWGITPVFLCLSLLDDPRSTVICVAGNTSHNLSFEKDILAGVFTSLNTANSIESCVRRACNRRGGDMTFLVGKSCFMVRCYSSTSCKIVKPSSPSSIDISITPYTWFGKSQLTEFSCQVKFLLCGHDASSSLQACVNLRRPVKLLRKLK